MITLPAAAAQLQSWWFDADQNRLVFTTDSAVQPRAQLIFNPTRVVIDLPGTTLGRPTANQRVGGAVREVRVGQFESQTTRLVIELNQGYTVDPQQVSVRGITANQWMVQLPTPERLPADSAGPTASPSSGGSANSVTGERVANAATQLDAVLTTPDGFFLRTRGEAPEITVERRGDRPDNRQILIDIQNSSISLLLRANALPINRYSISKWEVTQLPQNPPVTRLALTLAPESPDWQVTTSNLGGIILVPPSGVSISTIPDQPPNPEAIAAASEPISVPDRPQTPSLPDRPQPPANLPQVPNGRFVVVLDPGHGGRDPGAVGIGGLQEKTVVLPVSLRVAELLRDAGVQVIMTRSDDRTLDLEPRVDIANRANATIFVSIHANAISLSRPEVNGVETYYYTDSGRVLAEILQAAMLAASGFNDRGVRQARFYVLRNTDMPASLLELGFVTGQNDAPFLRDPVWRENISQAIARGILQYLQR
ncbi:MAG: N-acetylmuramoyl-L-alanine amidase [Cyanobacteria bacterium]|nr:N-acetylmuramoyl-L-alanine amidase [Cyanobacteriota bacterium]